MSRDDDTDPARKGTALEIEMEKRSRKTPTRLIIGAFAARHSLLRRRLPTRIDSILVSLYYEGLGDTLLLTPLIANLRRLYPGAAITLTIPPRYAALYAKRPYGVVAIPYDRRDRRTFFALKAGGPYDLAIIPFENRQAWLARAVGARWIRAFEGDAWRYRLPIDEAIPYPRTIEPVSDMWARLSGPDRLAVYNPADWPAPPPEQQIPYQDPYVVLHLTSSSPVRDWEPGHWRMVADELTRRGFAVILTTGPGQGHVAAAVDPEKRYVQYQGNLGLTTFWHLLARAQLLVVPDTGIAHLAKLTQTPAVVLFGQCDPAFYDPGRFWAGMPYRGLLLPDITCRDQPWYARRSGVLAELRRCMRDLEGCKNEKRCMRDLTADYVLSAIWGVLN